MERIWKRGIDVLGARIDKVTHWMHLPEPPEEGE